MKSLFKILNLVLCLELIVGPMIASGGHGLLISSAYAEDCPAGTSFDSTLNRCLTSEQTAEIMNAVSNCNGDKACYKSNAENALKEAEEEGKIKKELANKGGLINTSLKAAAVAVPLTMAVMMLKKSKGGVKCSSVSIWAMLGGGVALVAGDTLANMQHKGRLKKIKKEWDEILGKDSSTTPSTTTSSTTTVPAADSKVLATEAQSQAFEMLAKSEDSMASAAKMKTGFYGVATAAFAASAVLATLEAIKPPPANAGDICKTTPVDAGSPASSIFKKNLEETELSNYKYEMLYADLMIGSKDLATFLTLQSNWSKSIQLRSSPSIEDYKFYKNSLRDSGLEKDKNLLESVKSIAGSVVRELSPIQSSYAQAPNPPQAPDSKGLSNILLKPVTRAIFSGVLTVWAGIMTMHAMKQAKVSKNRATFLRKMKEDFNDASGSINSCSTADRGNPANPNCYCYTASGSRNSERANSSVCTALFTGKSANTVAGNYLLNSEVEAQGCISSSGSTDSTCACRSTNTCLKATSVGLGSINPGAFSMLSSPLTAVDSLGNGTLDAASVNGSASVSNASRLLDAANKLASKNKQGEEILKNKNKTADSINKGFTKSGSGLSGSDLLGSGASSFGNMTPSQAAAELEKDLKDADASGITEVKSEAITAGAPSQPDEQLDFGVSASDLAAQEGQMAQVMGQNLDYGANDINNSSTTNIFEVLSNRYQRSGMRRLFDDEGKAKAEPASKSDINP
jgi:hypothetical protein